VFTGQAVGYFPWRTKEGQASYSSIGCIFGVGTETARIAVITIANIICTHLKDQFIHFPRTNEEWKTSATTFERISEGRFRGIVGLVDGVHAPVHQPAYATDENDVYRNYKSFCSINRMAVANAQKMLVYMEAKWPGSVNDKRVVKNSDLTDCSFIRDS